MLIFENCFKSVALDFPSEYAKVSRFTLSDFHNTSRLQGVTLGDIPFTASHSWYTIIGHGYDLRLERLRSTLGGFEIQTAVDHIQGLSRWRVDLKSAARVLIVRGLILK